MMSAEYLAVETRLVQRLIASQQREMDQMLIRFASVGTQSALIAGFSIGTTVSIPPQGSLVEADGYIPENWATYTIFWCVSILIIAVCGQNLISTLLVCNWGPTLALRGPSGSTARAYHCVMRERKQINFFFILSLILFGAQCVLSVFLLDDTEAHMPVWLELRVHPSIRLSVLATPPASTPRISPPHAHPRAPLVGLEL